MKVAIVHFWFVNMRGGEQMIETLLELFPEADIFTHVHDPSSVSPLLNSRPVYTSYIQKLPFAKKLYQKYLPLMPGALIDFDLQGYDLIISSETGPVKGIVPNPDAFHICYSHSPMRYIWDMYHEYRKNAGFLSRFFMRRYANKLRQWDISSANMVDRFVTNSSFSAKRIKRYYNRDAEIVYGPISIEKFLPLNRNPADYYLFFGQLTGYKRADLAIEACIASGRKLVVAGAGASKKDKRRWEKTGLITFRGRVSDDELCTLYSEAKALIFPGIEDLGFVPVEANAAGCPVIAYGRGGVLDTVKEGVTGLFFYEQSPESLIKALDDFESREEQFKDRPLFRAQVEKFSREAFKERMRRIVAEKKRL